MNDPRFLVMHEMPGVVISTFSTLSAAVADAERCANNNPGKRYHVYAAIRVSKAGVLPVETTRIDY